jgi:hypothetical protein
VRRDRNSPTPQQCRDEHTDTTVDSTGVVSLWCLELERSSGLAHRVVSPTPVLRQLPYAARSFRVLMHVRLPPTLQGLGH